MDTHQQLTAAAAKAAAYDLRLVLEWEHESMGSVSAGVLKKVIHWLDSASASVPQPELLPAQD